MNTAVSTLSGVWRGCEDGYGGFERLHQSYAGSGPDPYGSSQWWWDRSPPTPPMASRAICEAPVVPMRGNPGAFGGGSSSTCDKCDGAHDTSACPHFRGQRDVHKDAWGLYSGAAVAGKAHLQARECVAPRSISRGSASIVRMPGDGSCLFHSIAYGLGAFGHQEDGHTVRQRVSNFFRENPDREISGNPMSSWLYWDSRLTVSNYCSRLSADGFWGGAIEMAACAQIFGVDIGVYEEDYYGGGFRRISDFLCDTPPRGAVLVSYHGRAHYNALAYTGGGAANYSATRYGQSSHPAQAEDDSQCSFM